MRQVEVRGRLEQHLLITSIAVTLVIGALGLAFGFLTGSFVIMSDGVYAPLTPAWRPSALASRG